MGVILVDKVQEGERKALSANWWTWRPAIEIIRSFNLLDDGMLDRMGVSFSGGEVNAEQAHVIGRRLKEEVLPKIQPEERVLLDLNTTSEVDDGKMHYDDQFKNYSATREWLEWFADFCLESQGFEVL